MCLFFCSCHILTSSVIYYWTDTWQLGIYLLNWLSEMTNQKIIGSRLWYTDWFSDATINVFPTLTQSRSMSLHDPQSLSFLLSACTFLDFIAFSSPIHTVLYYPHTGFFLKSCPGIVQVWLYKSHNSDSGAEEQYHWITRLPGLSKKTCTQKYWMRYQTESLLLLLPNIFHRQRKPQKWLSSCKNK